MLPRLCRWLAGTQDIHVKSKRIEERRVTVEFVNNGRDRFAGLLGIALPTAAEARQVTVNGRPTAAVRCTTWGSVQYVYVSVALGPGKTAALSIVSDRVLVP